MTPTHTGTGAVRPVRAGRDRPIIFSAPMVRALLDGRKTQTRRIVKRPMDHFHASYTHVHQDGDRFVWSDGKGGCQRVARVPGAVGDRLWVREAWRTGGDDGRADYLAPSKLQPHPVWYEASGTAPADDLVGKLRPSIFMPRWASRLTLIVKAVKVERLQDISEEDSVAEGVWNTLRSDGRTEWREPDAGDFIQSARHAFFDVWRTIHGPDVWDANPWVCALSFRAIAQNIDSLRDTPFTDVPSGDQPQGGGL